VYGEEGLARKEAELWLQERSLTLEYAGEALSRYDVEIAGSSTHLKDVTRPRIFETSHTVPQLRLFKLDALGQQGWLKALKLDEYVPRNLRRPASLSLQQALFTHAESWG
jgi:hypothetical protein